MEGNFATLPIVAYPRVRSFYMRNPNRHWPWITILLVFLSSIGLAQTTPDIRQLEQGKPIERELSGGAVHAYSIQLTEGQFLSVIVDQRGIDVAVTLLGPDGKQIEKVDSPNGANGPEPLSVLAKASGLYLIEVRSLDTKIRAGRYEVRIEALREATPEDKKFGRIKDLAVTLANMKTQEEGVAALAKEPELVTVELWQALNELGRPQQSPQATVTYRLGLRIAEQLGYRQGVAKSLNNIGVIYRNEGDLKQAMEYFQKAVPLIEELGDNGATLLVNIGIIHQRQGNSALALEVYEKVLNLYKASAGFAVTSARLNIANIHLEQGDYSRALEELRTVLKLSEEQRDSILIANTQDRIGWASFLLGDYQEALKNYRESLARRENLGLKPGVAATLTSLSLVYRATGNFAQALDCAQRGLAMQESLGNKLGAANAQMNIGLVYGSMGDRARALEYYRKSLALSEDLGNKGLIANAIEKIADAFNVQGDYTEALEYAHRSLKLNEEIKNYRQTIFSLLTIGNIHQSRGDYAQAQEYFQKALALSEKLGDKREIADALNRMSYSSISQGNYPQALETAQRAAEVAGQIGNRELLLDALNTTGLSYFSLNQLENARRASEQAIELVESLRANVAGHEARASYFALARDPYELDVDVLMQLHKLHPSEGYGAAALQMSERARARSLLETLSEANADIRQGVDPALLTGERTLQQRLNAAAERQTRILSGKHTEEQANAVQKEIDALTGDYQQVEAQIRQSSPRYAALTQPVPLMVREIQSEVLDSDTALLEYALGEDRSYLWVVTPTSVKSFELPKRAEIETSVRRVVGLLSDGKRWATNVQINAEYAGAADQLSRTLLPPALMSQLKARRLVIVGDGALQYLPFGALPVPMPEGTVARRQGSVASGIGNRPQTPDPRPPLIADYEIVSLPSASTLAVLRRETANRARPTKSVAVLADPVFEETDERVQAATAQGRQVGNGQPSAGARNVSFDQSINSQALLRALDFKSNADAGEATPEQLHIARLPFTRFEAEGILASAPKGQSLKATDFRANRETATGADLGTYRFVHFATHGILNSEHPELSGIVLSLVNERGQPADGFLRLNEIYNLNLSADLVVLSACQTGLGKEIRGEGLVGLTRGFMYAGAPRVVASLWKVDDAATAELMKRFYEGMLKNNLRPAAALRAAKVEMWKQKRWSAPFYWAAFELQGEWK
jgi:CHAT domain-containing protein/tetratricopeptide (TPR) repeat protein